MLLFATLCGGVLAEDDVLQRALRTIERADQALARAKESRARRRHARRSTGVRPPQTVASSAANAAEQIPLPEEGTAPRPAASAPAIRVTSLNIDDLEPLPPLSDLQRALVQRALDLTTRQLGASRHSDDPNAGGLDAGGFVQYVLKPSHADVPHDPAEIYLWARKSGEFHAVLSRDPTSPELAELAPGDLMFWSTVDAWNQQIPITQVTLYIGKERLGGKPVMVGSSRGSLYHHTPMTGLSVLDVQQSASDPAEDYLLPRLVGYVSFSAGQAAP
jgi:cell wall-associated NlpC family hydrolase